MLSRKPSINCSVVIPAYNEAGTIGTTLECLLRGAWKDEFEVVVVCNGCFDDTASVVRNVAPEVKVLELETASKTAALNEGIATAKHSTIVLLDADIKTSANAVRMLIKSLKSHDADLAYGNAHFNITSSSCLVKAFYQVWLQNPYFDRQKVGGFFALSFRGLGRLGKFPETTNDDEYVRRKLIQKSVFVRAAYYVVEAPRVLSSLMRVRSRVYRGNAELSDVDAGLDTHHRLRNGLNFLNRIFVRPNLWAGAVVFALVAVAARLRNYFLNQNTTGWEQDLSARTVASRLNEQ